MPAHGLRDTGHRKGKIRGQEYVVAACHMILAENRAWAGNSQPGTPQSPPTLTLHLPARSRVQKVP